jgi:nucleotide-binding universal stress UspA family protein
MAVINALLPVGGGTLDYMADQAIRLHRHRSARLHLLSVQPPLSRHVTRYFHPADVRAFHDANGMRALEPMMRRLDQAQVPYKTHVQVGWQAETIVAFAREYWCRCIVMQNQAGTWLEALGLGQIGSQVRKLLTENDMKVSLEPGEFL